MLRYMPGHYYAPTTGIYTYVGGIHNEWSYHGDSNDTLIDALLGLCAVVHSSSCTVGRSAGVRCNEDAQNDNDATRDAHEHGKDGRESGMIKQLSPALRRLADDPMVFSHGATA